MLVQGEVALITVNQLIVCEPGWSHHMRDTPSPTPASGSVFRNMPLSLCLHRRSCSGGLPSERHRKKDSKSQGREANRKQNGWL